MPLYGSVTRIKKGLYEVVIKFVQSKRVLHVEQIGAPNPTAVKLFFRLEYPTLTWGKPKYPKPKVAKPRKPKKVKDVSDIPAKRTGRRRQRLG